MKTTLREYLKFRDGDGPNLCRVKKIKNKGNIQSEFDVVTKQIIFVAA